MQEQYQVDYITTLNRLEKSLFYKSMANDLLEKLGGCKRFEPSCKCFVSKLYSFAK
jgi:hypothetical protein